MSKEPLGNLNGSGIVTGGASGFGRACVERPRAEGMPVLVADVNVVQANLVGTFLLGVRDLWWAIASNGMLNGETARLDGAIRLAPH